MQKTAKTANQIKDSFQVLASGHLQINSFAYDQEFNQQAYPSFIYPLMFVDPLGGTLNGTIYTRTYRVAIADRVLKSEDNKLEVLSDTQLIILDVLAYWMKLGQNERFTITSTNTITPFYDKWGDEVTGHFVDIGIEEFYDFNSCAIPLSGSIPTPPNPCKDARISVNSVVYGNAPSDSNFNVVVKDQDGDLVGSLIGGEWIVNTGGSCADATYTIEDTLGNVLYTGSIVSGGSLTQAIGNSTLNINDSAGTLISSESILAEGTDSYNVADSVAVIKDSAGTTLKSENILATASENITINDSVAVIKDSANLTLKSENILAEATENIVINDSLVNVRKSDNVLISAVSVKAENTENYLVADSTITNAAISPTYSQLVKATEGLILPTQEIQNNGVASGFIPSVGTINVTTNAVPTSFTITGRTIDIVVPSGGSPSGVLFKTIQPTQYTSYRTGDVGDRVQTGWFDYTPPSNPAAVADLDYSSTGFFNVLASPLIVNGISSTTRFVDVDGGQTFSATGNKHLVVIDKLTGMMYNRNSITSKATWNACIDDALSYSVVVDSVTYDDWYLACKEEFESVYHNFAGVNPETDTFTSVVVICNSLNIASSTTSATNTANYHYYQRSLRFLQPIAKTTGLNVLYVRDARNLITAP